MKVHHFKSSFFILMVLAVFTSCSKSSKDTVTEAANSNHVSDISDTPSDMPSAAAVPGNSSNTAASATSYEAAPVSPSAQSPIRDIPSTALVQEFQIGWNLGNTLDATGGTGLGSETSWGNVKTSKALITALKEMGFQAVRLPVTWENHMGSAPDYQIETAWLDRVQEVVDYGIENGLYVILNLHHEEWYYPSYAKEEAAVDRLTKVWSQIAARFQNYDEHLLFEGMNEPRQKGTAYEWNGGNKEGQEVVNHLNEAFIKTIRTSSGNNPLRHLMIPPYAAASSVNAWEDFTLPQDDKVIISIHAYTPYDFALNVSGTGTWSSKNSSDTAEITALMKNLNTWFLSKGYPVILGEFGAVNKENETARADWAKYYADAAKEAGIPFFWWDNGAVSGNGELFGLIDRKTNTCLYPDILASLTGKAK